jgi:glycosyltransferase involved in cell wall biosynthesis
MEGFGLPPLEAMAYGKPVIVSDIPVFHELFGDLPIFVSLGSSASWKEAFQKLIQPGSKSEAGHLQKGQSIASKYSALGMDKELTAALENFWLL